MIFQHNLQMQQINSLQIESQKGKDQSQAIQKKELQVQRKQVKSLHRSLKKWNHQKDKSQRQKLNRNLQKCSTKKQKNFRNQSKVTKILSKTFSISSSNSNTILKSNESTYSTRTKFSTSLMHFKSLSEIKTGRSKLTVLSKVCKVLE